MRTVKAIKRSENETRLEKRVRGIINRLAKDYDTGATGVICDLMQAGCASGMIPDLIYYKDTIAFYNYFKPEINSLIKELTFSTGLQLSELKGWDDEDPLVLDQANQNIITWLAFEETARNLAEASGIEV